jgi:uncharacterized protein YjbI with pentapeptide repeats
MAKKARASPASKADWLAPKFSGKTFLLAGKFNSWLRDLLGKCIASEGGRVVEEPGPGVDFLVVVPTPGGGLPVPAKKILAALQQQGMAPEVLPYADLGQRVLPTREQAVAMLKSGDKEALERWNTLPQRCAPGWAGRADLAGADLRGAGLQGVLFGHANLDGADLRDTDLTGARLYNINGVRFDGATLSRTQLGGFHHCSFQGADLSACDFLWTRDWTGSNFQDAKLCSLHKPMLQAVGVCFRRADLTGAMVWQGNFSQADLTRTDLTKANLNGCDLTGAKLANARLRGADLSGATLVNADLSGADLREAILIGADLTGAAITGARFDKANLTGAKLGGLDPAKAKGLDLTPKGLGPRVLELEQAAQPARRFTTAAVFDLPDSFIEVSIEWKGPGKPVEAVSRHFRGGVWATVYRKPRSVGLAVAVLGHTCGGAVLRLDSVKAKCDGGTLRDKEVKQLALAAWCEAAGVEAVSPDSLKERQQAQKAGKEALREELLQELRGGAKGVAAWNARPPEQRLKASPFEAIDLTGADLTGADLHRLAFPGANFSGVKLTGADLNSCDLRQANLEKADLTEVVGRDAKFTRANLAGAVLRKADLWSATLAGADLTGADLREATLRGVNLGRANLCGADLSGAALERARFDAALHDEKTRWSSGIAPSHRLKWAGKTKTPAAPKPTVAPVPGLDFDSFMTRLRGQVDGARLGNALQMLKAERFQLFAEVKPEALVGIVRSQSSTERIYSCRLAADGSFACCTQNLRPCGGLAGSLCKHLFVLIVGLAKAGAVDPSTVDAWVRASRMQRPLLDKEVMSETFLRYKGAEAGEVDWRPTETIPEDYYAL